MDDDPETLFARGDKLALACVDVSNIELIRGISDSLAFEIVAARRRIEDAYASTRSEQEAFQQVRGVGPATSMLLTKFIVIQGPCRHKTFFGETLQNNPH
jgi:hypothetical protein